MLQSGEFSPSHRAASRVLALAVAANGRVDARELAELSRLDAYRRLGIDGSEFADMALREVGDAAMQLEDHGVLRSETHTRLLGWLAEVADPTLRLLVCRLAAAVITADGQTSRGERCLYGMLLGGWGVTPIMVAYAIMRDPGKTL